MAFPHPIRQAVAALILSLLSLSPAVAQGTGEEQAFQEAERYYAAGMRQSDNLQKGRYMTYVIGLYTNYIENYSGSKNEAAARFHLGYARQSLGRIEEAKNTYRFLVERHRRGPHVGQASRQMAYLCFVEENWEEAAKYFGVASQNLPDENLRYTALSKQVECLLKLDRQADVAVALRRIIDIKGHPHKDWATFMLAYQYFERDDFETTIRLLRPLVTSERQGQYHSQAVFYTGLASAELGLEGGQDSHLKTILNMSIHDPSLTLDQKRHLATNKARAQTSLMGLYTKKKEWDTVINLYEKGDFGATGVTEARRCERAGLAYLIKQNYLSARNCYRRVDRALPKSHKAFEASFKCLKCDYYIKNPALTGRVDTFFELYERKYPEHEYLNYARFFQAEMLYHRSALEAAALAFNKIDRNLLEPDMQRELLYKHGWCLSESGQYDGASRSFARFLAEFADDPRVAEVYNKRAEAYLSLGDYTSALKDFEKALALNPAPEHAAFALQGSARVLRQEKKYESMITRYRRALGEFKDLPIDTIANANYWIGWGYYKLEKYSEAPPYLQKARDLVPEFYSQPVGDLLILSTFNMRDKMALHTALQEVYDQAPAKVVPKNMLSWLGVQMFHDGQVEEGVDYLERATDLEAPERTDIGVWRILAKAQNRSGRFTGAQKTSLLLLGQEQDVKWQADAYLDLAEARLGLGLYPETLEAVAKGLAINTPGSHIAGLHIVGGEVGLLQGRWKEALEEFSTAIPMIPDDPLLQPRALHGAYLAASNDANETLAAKYKARLASAFPGWKPSLKLEAR
ncbi:tetratricopeptide repeat protein [bacterium]|nr:tetratricopeptide repeat protein [bacterium]